eukprot:SAG11_NODE_15291_length_583_cov_0.595041_1_plen_104_part_01
MLAHRRDRAAVTFFKKHAAEGDKTLRGGGGVGGGGGGGAEGAYEIPWDFFAALFVTARRHPHGRTAIAAVSGAAHKRVSARQLEAHALKQGHLYFEERVTVGAR